MINNATIEGIRIIRLMIEKKINRRILWRVFVDVKQGESELFCVVKLFFNRSKNI